MIGRIRAALTIAGIAILVPFAAEFFSIGYEWGSAGDPSETDAGSSDDKVSGDAGQKPASEPAVNPAATPAPVPIGDVYECGRASYYSDSATGKATSSGELYDPQKYTAAHKTLPYGTKLQVVRTDNNASVEVTVNDRGPFTPGRVVDISRAAAEKIDLVIDGVTEVCLYIK